MTKSKTAGQLYDKYSVSLADITALGANASGSVTLDTLPAGTVITNVLLKPTTALAGGAVSAATARVTTTSPTKTFGTAAYDVFQATGDTVHSYDGTSQFMGIAATPALLLTFTTTGGNLNALTAGAVDVYLEYETVI